MKFYDCANVFCDKEFLNRESGRKFEDIPDFFWNRGLTESYFEMLGKCAEFNAEAAARLHYVATLAVQYLNQAAFQSPQIFQPIAETQITWPGYLSDHPEAEYEQKKHLFPRLHLGKKSGIRLKGKKFSLNTLETRIAFELWVKMEYIRNQKKLSPAGKRTPFGILKDDIKKLPMLSRKNYQLWWKVGKKLFLMDHGEKFESNEKFAGYWNTNHPAYKDRPNRRPLIRNDIKRKIKQGFKSIAEKSSVM